MRKLILAFLVAVLFLTITACGTTEKTDQGNQAPSVAVSGEENNIQTSDKYTFTGTVLSVEDQMMLVHTDEENSAISPQVYVNISRFPELELKKGDKVRVVFNGQVAQSFPPQIFGVIEIKIEK